MADVKLFLSCVSDEFGAYRESLRHALTRPNVEIKIQEDFKALGGDTLAMLEEYIEQCDAVVHFIGEMAGSAPAPTSVDDLLARRPELAARLADKGMGREALGELTYTQWEAWLAIGFNQYGAKRNLVIVAPAAGVKRDETFRPTDASRASQAEHLRRLQRDQPLSRPAIHQRRRSREAGPRVGGPRRVDRRGNAAEDKAPQSSAALARRPVRRPRGSARRPAQGASRREGRRCRAAWAGRGGQDAARDRIWMGARGRLFGAHVRERQRCGEPERGPRRARRRRKFWTCRRRRRATTRRRSPRLCAGSKPTRPG